MLFYDLFRDDPRFRLIKEGHTLFNQGDHGEFMYVLIEGRATILIRDQSVERMIPGSIAGEMAMLDDGPRTATVVAETDCRFAEIDRKRFHFLVTETPNFALQVMHVLALRLREMDHRFEESLGGDGQARTLRSATQSQRYSEGSQSTHR